MPGISGARREQSPPPPAKRNRWYCPTCGARGWAQNARAAQAAGVDHFLRTHDLHRADACRGEDQGQLRTGKTAKARKEQ